MFYQLRIYDTIRVTATRDIQQVISCFIFREEVMRYQDRIHQIFTEYKDTAKARKLKEEAMKKYGARYMILARDVGNSEAQEMVDRELNTIRQTFPAISRLPKANDKRERLPRVTTILLFVVLMVGVGGLYFYHPIIGYLAQILAGAILIPLQYGMSFERHEKQDKVLPSLYLIFLLVPLITFYLSNLSNQELNPLWFIGPFLILIVVFLPVFYVVGYHRQAIIDKHWNLIPFMQFDQSRTTIDIMLYVVYILMTTMANIATYGAVWFDGWFNLG